MPRPEIAPGDPCWIDLLTSDPAAAKEFYATLFGWTYEVGDTSLYNGYTTASKGGRGVAGIMANDGTSGSPDAWTTYLRVDDVGLSSDAAVTGGGRVYLPPMVVPEQGEMAVVGDSSGAAVGLWQFGAHTGFQLHGEPGSAVWHELQTREYDAAVKFYRRVFGWETDVMSDSPEFRYTTLGIDREAKAGILDAGAYLPAGVPDHWVVYFGVESADAAVAQAVALGATVLEPAADTPFGRIATLADPTGATFRVDEETQNVA